MGVGQVGGGRSSNTNIAPRLYVQFEHSLLVLKVKYYACRIYFQENTKRLQKFNGKCQQSWDNLDRSKKRKNISKNKQASRKKFVTPKRRPKS